MTESQKKELSEELINTITNYCTNKDMLMRKHYSDIEDVLTLVIDTMPPKTRHLFN